MTTRTSKYFYLTNVVEVQWSSGFWEAIAAFNDDSAATQYAIDCRGTNKHLSYRVLERKGSKWKVVREWLK